MVGCVLKLTTWLFILLVDGFDFCVYLLVVRFICWYFMFAFVDVVFVFLLSVVIYCWCLLLFRLLNVVWILLFGFSGCVFSFELRVVCLVVACCYFVCVLFLFGFSIVFGFVFAWLVLTLLLVDFWFEPRFAVWLFCLLV